MAEGYQKPYLDSSVFIGGLRKELCRGIKRDVVFEYIWNRALEGQCKIYTSALTLTEVYKRRDSAHQLGEPILDELRMRRRNGKLRTDNFRRTSIFCRRIGQQTAL